MKIVQKLELVAGAATLLTSILYFYFKVLPVVTLDKENDIDQKLFIKTALFLIVPGFLTAVGSYIHTVKQSQLGLVLLILGGGVLIIFFGLLLVTFATFYYYGWVGGLLAVTPGIFSATTIILAIRSRKLSSFPK